MTTPNDDAIDTRLASLTDEFPGYQFSLAEIDGGYRISVHETESWVGEPVAPAEGATIDEAVATLRAALADRAG